MKENILSLLGGLSLFGTHLLFTSLFGGIDGVSTCFIPALIGLGTALAGMFADRGGGPDDAWAPSDEDLDNQYAQYFQGILGREGAMPELSQGLWGALGSHIPTDQSLAPIMEAYMMGGPRRDRMGLLNLGQNASAARAGIAASQPPPSAGIGQLGAGLAQMYAPFDPQMPQSNTANLFSQLMGYLQGGGSGAAAGGGLSGLL